MKKGLAGLRVLNPLTVSSCGARRLQAHDEVQDAGLVFISAEVPSLPCSDMDLRTDPRRGRAG